MIITQRAARVLDGSGEGRTLLSFAVDLQVKAASINALERGERNVNVLVDQLAKHRTAPLFHTNDAHRQTHHLELFADRVNVRVELVLDICAEHHNQLAVRYFFGLDEATIRHRLVFDLSHVRSYAED